ncbi:TPA: hypothetical protein HA219_03945 [Candidatus Woesearchaeota archaeon]|nr:hypothetical protein [Candidatus Woesearchaeota archaeon]HIH39843.1 hypothetical protein [Candidatus Woesearchaeota archaeon]
MAKEVQTTLEQTALLKKSEISLSLDNYDDIFSDFDPRPFSQRALSDDFLIEAKKASRDKVSGIELNFLIPKSVRKPSEENIIKKRLKDHFKKHYHSEKQETLNIRRFGARFAGIGIVLMFLATFILFRFPDKSFVMNFLVVLLEPAGWFLLWEGLNQVIFEPRKHREDMEFYRKMSSCEINFFEY